jgi:hypothetical protein
MKLVNLEPHGYLKKDQKVIVSGGFDEEKRDQAYTISRNQLCAREPYFDSNHEEGDSRVWLHPFISSKTSFDVFTGH